MVFWTRVALKDHDRRLTFAQINQIHRDDVECKLNFAGFLVFHCPLKPDAVEILKMLNDSSHRVCRDELLQNVR